MPLDPRRVCRVVVSGVRTRRASGYLIAPGLVLTSAHVFDTAEYTKGTPMHAEPWGRPELAGELLWRGQGDLDAALVSLPAGSDEPDGAPVRWGELTGTTEVTATAVGYPLVSRTNEGLMPAEQRTGTVEPITHEGRQYDLLLRGPYPEPVDDRSPWAGLSGAALFSGGMLVGVVRLAQPQWRYGRLGAVPVAQLVRDAEFRARLAEHGCAGELSSVELDPLFNPPADPGSSPAGLLRADSELVRFHGRDASLGVLLDWCDGAGQLSLGLVTGPGGQGKTRLARELLRRVREQGWAGGFLTEIRKSEAALAPILDSARPLLVVVDYAEGREQQVLELARVMSRPANRKLRILSLARATGRWWTDLTALKPWQCALGPELALTPLEVDEGGRDRAYRDAAEDFGTAMSRLAAWRGPDWPAAASRLRHRDLRDHAYGIALPLQMQALLDLLAEGAGGSRTTGAEGLEEKMLEHEAGYWARTPGAPPDRRDVAVAVATLAGAATAAEAAALLVRVGHHASDAPSVADWLARLYPAAGSFWGSLQPDRIGEWLIARVWRENGTFVPDVLAAASDGQLRDAALALGRMVSTHADLRGRIAELLADKVGGALLASAGPYAGMAMLRELDDPSARLMLTLVERRALTLAGQSPPERAGQLELAAHQAGWPDAAASLVAAFPDRPMRTRWVHWHPLPTARIVEDGPAITAVGFAAGPADVVAFGDVDGLVQVVALEDDPRPQPVTRHDGPVTDVHVVVIDGRRHLLSLARRDPVGRVTALDGASPSWTFPVPFADTPHFQYYGTSHLAAIGHRAGEPVVALAFGADIWILPFGSGDGVARPVHAPQVISALTGAGGDREAVFLAGDRDGGVHRITVAGEAHLETLVRGEAAQIDQIALPPGAAGPIAYGDGRGRAFVLGDGGPVPVFPRHDVKSVAPATMGGQPLLLAVAETNSFAGSRVLLVVSLDPATYEPIGDVREEALGGEWSIHGTAEQDGRVLALCANRRSRGAQVIAVGSHDIATYTVEPDTAVHATMATRADGVIVATVSTGSRQSDLTILRLPWDPAAWPESDQLRVWDLLVGDDPGGNPVVGLRHGVSGGHDVLRGTVLTLVRVDTGPPPVEFTEGKDYYYDRMSGMLRGRTRRTARSLPALAGSRSVKLGTSINNHFLRERGWTIELDLDPENGHIVIRGGGGGGGGGADDEERILIREPDGRPIHEYAPIWLSGTESAVVYVNPDSVLLARCDRDRVTSHTLMHTPDRHFTSLYVARLGGTAYLVGLSAGADDTEIWVCRLGAEQPSFRLATLADRVANVHLLRSGHTDLVVVSRTSGRVTWYAIPERGATVAPEAVVDLGAVVREYAWTDDTLIAATADGILAAELRDPQPDRSATPAADPVERRSEWRAFADRTWPDLARPPAPEVVVIPWGQWAVLGVLVLLAVCAAARNGPFLPTLPAWLLLAALFWCDAMGYGWRQDRWSVRLGVAGLLVCAPAVVRGEWMGLAPLVAVPVAVVVIGLITHEPTLPSGDRSYTFFTTLTGRRASWEDMAAAFWLLPRGMITVAQDRAWYAALFALYLASISVDALLTGALLPVVAGLWGLAIMRRRYRWNTLLDSYPMVFVGGLIGVFVHLPITGLIRLVV